MKVLFRRPAIEGQAELLDDDDSLIPNKLD